MSLSSWFFVVSSASGVLLIAMFAYYLKTRERLIGHIARKKKVMQRQIAELHQNEELAAEIQLQLHPSESDLTRIFPDSFLLNLPKQKVGGDILWLGEVDQKIIVAAVDCTGHGMEGSFMSLVAHEKLKRIVYQENLTQPEQILERLHVLFSEAFKEEQAENMFFSDGMDVSVCVVDRSAQKLHFSGALSPAIFISKEKLMELRPHVFGIGQRSNKPIAYLAQSFQIEKGDCVFLYSDGFADQFGGDSGKKLNKKRFQQMVSEAAMLPMQAARVYLRQCFDDWRRDSEQTDDVLVVGIRF